MRIISQVAILFVISSFSFAQTLMSDAVFDGLKGKVKRVLTYESDIEVKNRKTIVTPRKLENTEEYDESGNSTMTILHRLGDKTFFKFIDGEKTSKTELFDVPGVFRIQGTPLGEKQSENIVRDPRFHSKYKYAHDDRGRIIEERRFGNDGKQHSHWKYKYDEKGNLVEETAFRGESISDDTTTNTFDLRGNLIESRNTVSGPISEDNVTAYRYGGYKLDSRGNWIQRTITIIYYEDGKKIENKGITYREITYFD